MTNNYRMTLAAVTFILLGGCGNSADMSKSDEQSFKQSLATGKGAFDINKVPPAQRERVRAMMQANRGPRGGPTSGK